jgi:DNA repair photolyase
MKPPPSRGRGAGFNPDNRFASQHIELEPDALVDDDGNPLPLRTVFYPDDSQSIISWNDSPDIPFRAGLNPYRGCEHGCAYCYARPTHEYLGFSAGLEFESRIMVKTRAAELLRAEFMKKSWQPQTIMMSGVTDCYQPVERRLEITRSCLAVLAEFRNPIGIVTKNHLVTRDIDYLSALAKHRAAGVGISITSLDPELTKVLEPRASTTNRRLAAIQELSAAGIRVRVMVSPVIPGLNDHEIPAILAAARKAGARFASYILLRLPLAVAPIFTDWLENHRPGEKDKILGRIRELRDGALNVSTFRERQRGSGPAAEQLRQLFTVAKRRAGFTDPEEPLLAEAFRRPSEQMSLFD